MQQNKVTKEMHEGKNMPRDVWNYAINPVTGWMVGKRIGVVGFGLKSVQNTWTSNLNKS